NQTDKHNQLIAELCKLPLPGLGESEIRQVYDLLKRYFGHIQLDDLANESQQDILGGVVAHWQLMRERRSGVPKIRVYNPNFEEHGWQSRKTIIEISTDNQAFLVDSLSMALNRAGITIDLTIHPLIRILRDEKGHLQALFDSDDKRGVTEALVRFQIEKQLLPEQLKTVQTELQRVLLFVTHTNADWTEMRERVNAIRKRLTDIRPPEDASELAEADDMLKWIVENHFTFLGYCELDLLPSGENSTYAITPDSSLGVLRGAGDTLDSLIPLEISRQLETGCCMVVTKANQRSLVHRPA
ncbi:MAG: NAD-glutamate dehydrogenase, partial [Gammaproteobacteria bacterium]|nr:NAD-glutamate dehydrogenase [Gammaproteobacteria bacterium]